MFNRFSLTGFILLTSTFGGTAWAHGHIPALDENDPLAADIRLCNDVVDAALQALKNRDRDRPLALHEGGDLRTRLINEVSSHVYAEPQIRSQKFAMSYGRARCNEVLLEEKEKVTTPR
jgi:hypothetical protein